jgi:acyl-CoA dehydrogenase
MNLEIPKKLLPAAEGAYFAAKSIFRPISRKYDVEEHVYPKELDLFAAAIKGATEGGMAMGGAGGDKSATDSGPKDYSQIRNGGNMSNILNIQAISYGDVGLVLTIPGQGLGNAAIAAVADEQQLKKFGKMWAAMAITEPGTGSDSGNIKTTAVKDGDEYILNGEKIYITCGERADCIVVWATLDRNLGKAAIKSFIVEQGTPGMRLERLEHKMGIRASDTAAVVFTDCRIPATNLLGDPTINVEKGFAGVMETFDNTRPFVAAMALGVIEASLERTKEILENHVELDYKTPINNIKSVEADLYRMEADYEASRLLTLKAAWMADNKKPNSLEASICKAKAARVGNAVSLKCVELTSSLGYTQDELLEKWARDSKILDIFEGTQQIQQLIIARRILGKSSTELK